MIHDFQMNLTPQKEVGLKKSRLCTNMLEGDKCEGKKKKKKNGGREIAKNEV